MQITNYYLNANQIHTLLLIYKFRFITSTLLCQYNKLSSPSVTNNALQILHKQKYLLKRYDASYRLSGKGAVYSLDKRAIRYLIETQNIAKASLHAFYNNSSVSDDFVAQQLDTVRAYLALRAVYPTQFDIFTKQELHAVQQLPEKLPDLYLRPTAQYKDSAPSYLLELHNNTQLFITKKRIQTLIQYFEDDWDSPTMPALLMVAKNGADERRIQIHALERLESAGIEEELQIYTTTMPALLDAKQTQAIWSNVIEPKKLCGLIDN